MASRGAFRRRFRSRSRSPPRNVRNNGPRANRDDYHQLSLLQRIDSALPSPRPGEQREARTHGGRQKCSTRRPKDSYIRGRYDGPWASAAAPSDTPRSVEEAAYASRSDVAGMVFLCNRHTRKECIRRRLFGVPAPYLRTARRLRHGVPLFLYDTTRQEFFAGFVAAGDGHSNIQSGAWGRLKAQEERRARDAYAEGYCYRSRYGRWEEAGCIFAAQAAVEMLEVFPPVRATDAKALLNVDPMTRKLTTLELDASKVGELLRLFMDAKSSEWEVERDWVAHTTSYFSQYISRGDWLPPVSGDGGGGGGGAGGGGGGAAAEPPAAPAPRRRSRVLPAPAEGGMEEGQVTAWLEYLKGGVPDHRNGECCICLDPTSGADFMRCHRSSCPRPSGEEQCTLPICCTGCMRDWLETRGTCLICRALVRREPPDDDGGGGDDSDEDYDPAAEAAEAAEMRAVVEA